MWASTKISLGTTKVKGVGVFEESKIIWEIKCKCVHPARELFLKKKKETGCLCHIANVSNVRNQNVKISVIYMLICFCDSMSEPPSFSVLSFLSIYVPVGNFILNPNYFDVIIGSH